jgi:hypothetical protein
VFKVIIWASEVEGHTQLVFARPEPSHDGAAFSFTFEIPANADLERLRAAFLGGVLRVSAPCVAAVRDSRPSAPSR